MSAIIPDISHYEEINSWGTVSATAPFIITKATQRTNWMDPTLKSVVEGCRKKNIPYYLYAYIERGSIDYHVDQVKYLIKVTAELGILGNADTANDKYFMGWCLDIENGNSVAGAIAAFKYLMSVSAPYKVLVYTGYLNYNAYKELIKYVLKEDPERVCWWEARYGKNTPIYNLLHPPHKGCGLHQYTEHGKYPGITGEVDLNRLTGEKPLSWFINPYEEVDNSVNESVYKPKKYSGDKVTKFPPRGYFKKGDGYVSLKSEAWKGEIKKIQKIVSWITDRPLTIDGEYGAKTELAVIKAQYILKVYADGLFGKKTNKAAMKYKK